MDRIKFFDTPITTQFIPKKKLIHDFIKSWKDDHFTHSFIEEFCFSHTTLNVKNVVISGDMYGIITPDTKKFYNSLAEFIGVVFLIHNTPFNCNYTCIGTPDNILAFRYLFRQASQQNYKDWKKYDKSSRDYSLWTWEEDYSSFIYEKYTQLDEKARLCKQHEYINMAPQIRRWYRQQLKNN